jgi:methylmalonyl-CoA mutase
MERVEELLQEVEKLGGMTKAIEAGLPKLRIEEAAAIKQARLDSVQDVLVGVNAFKSDDDTPLEILEVDQTAVLANQIERLKSLKADRDPNAVALALEALESAARTGQGNLLLLSVEAARVRATLGEISDALERAFGRYQARLNMVHGVYARESTSDGKLAEVRSLADQFAARYGRRPRLLVAKMGQDGHDRGAKVIATGFADVGFDIDFGPLFQTPEEVAQQAIENDVHWVGVSSLAAGHKTLVPQLLHALAQAGRGDIQVVVGGVIPRQDYESLLAAGASAVFGPGTPVLESAASLLKKALELPAANEAQNS